MPDGQVERVLQKILLLDPLEVFAQSFELLFDYVAVRLIPTSAF